jgi:hypothetical protein
VKERLEGDIVPEGWSFTDNRISGGRIHLYFRIKDMIANVAVACHMNPETWSCGVKYRDKEAEVEKEP